MISDEIKASRRSFSVLTCLVLGWSIDNSWTTNLELWAQSLSNQHLLRLVFLPFALRLSSSTYQGHSHLQQSWWMCLRSCFLSQSFTICPRSCVSLSILCYPCVHAVCVIHFRTGWRGHVFLLFSKTDPGLDYFDSWFLPHWITVVTQLSFSCFPVLSNDFDYISISSTLHSIGPIEPLTLCVVKAFIGNRIPSVTVLLIIELVS